MPDNLAGSSLLLDEYFASGDERFLGEVFRSALEKKLGSMAARWYADARPFARAALLRYIDDGCDRPHHRALVKHLFKAAETAGDDEVMGHFMVALDRLTRRHLKRISRYDWRTREMTSGSVLRSDPSLPGDVHAAARASRFSRATRLYLARRAWRYFRYLAFREPERYIRAMRAALPLYEDENLQKAERLLDAWGLMHALYWGSPVLERDPRGIRVAEGQTLAQLEPAPLRPELWNDFAALLELFETSRSRTVRNWSLRLVRDRFAEELRQLPLDAVKRLLRSPHDEVQNVGAELLRNVRGLEAMPIADWLELLAIGNHEVVALVAELMAKHVAPERLTLAQLVQLASGRVAPVAELGFGWLEARAIRNADELRDVLRLANAETPGVRERATKWLLALSTNDFFAAEHLRDLLDSRFDDTRTTAFAFALAEPRYRTDVRVWQALAESPYDDMRAALIAHLASVERELERTSIRHVWATTLLGVHRGGRAKKEVIAQIATRIVATPTEADELLPLLAISLRSIRAPERRTALGALAQAAYRNPSLRASIGQHMPELQLFPEEAA